MTLTTTETQFLHIVKNSVSGADLIVENVDWNAIFALANQQKLLPILKMFPGKLKTVIYYADTGVRMGGRCMPEESCSRSCAVCSEKKCCPQMRNILQKRYTTVTICDTIYADIM